MPTGLDLDAAQHDDRESLRQWQDRPVTLLAQALGASKEYSALKRAVLSMILSI